MARPPRQGLRRYVSSHICRVRLPWFHDGSPAYTRYRRTLTYQLDPPAPLYLVPLVGLTWIALSFLRSWQVVGKHGRYIKRREGISRTLQFIKVVVRAIRSNHTPLSFYKTKAYRRSLSCKEDDCIWVEETRCFYSRHYGREDSDQIDRKDRFHDYCLRHGLPTIPILHVALGESNTNEAIKLPEQDLFSKPLNSFGAEGVALWEYDQTDCTWTLEGKKFTAPELRAYLESEAARLRKGDSMKYAQILQPRVRNHPDLAGLSLRSLVTARVLTIRKLNHDPFIYLAGLRMATDDSIVDTKQRLDASIDIQTGRLGLGCSQDVRFPDSETHPATGHQIQGLIVPGWEQAKRLVLRAHQSAPPLPIIGWDLAFTPDGPLLVEGNTCPRMNSIQAANQRSLISDEFVDAILSWLPEEQANRVPTTPAKHP